VISNKNDAIIGTIFTIPNNMKVLDATNLPAKMFTEILTGDDLKNNSRGD
jgi:hypothetical protein